MDSHFNSDGRSGEAVPPSGTGPAGTEGRTA